MAEPIPAVTDRDILLDAIVQRLKARKPTAELGKRPAAIIPARGG